MKHMFDIGGEKLMSIREALEYEMNRNVSLRDSVPWSEGGYTTDFLCPRLFSDGEVYYAPMASKDNPVYMAATPIGDQDWKQLPKDFVVKKKKFKVGDELSPDDIEVGMIVDIVSKSGDGMKRNNVTVLELLICGGFQHSESTFGNYRSFKVIFKGYSESPEVSSQQHNNLSEQSIEEAVKTLSQAAQELSTGISVDEEGNIVIYSDYHQDEIKFDTTEKFMQYIECVKEMNKFGG